MQGVPNSRLGNVFVKQWEVEMNTESWLTLSTYDQKDLEKVGNKVENN